MKKVVFSAISLLVFAVAAIVSYILISYLLLSVPPFNRAVIPDANTGIAVMLSALISVGLATYATWKFYLYLVTKQKERGG